MGSEPDPELEDELGRAVVDIIVEHLSDREIQPERVSLLTWFEVLVLGEVIAKGLLEAGWRRG